MELALPTSCYGEAPQLFQGRVKEKGREVVSLPLDQHCCPSLFSTSESGFGVK